MDGDEALKHITLLRGYTQMVKGFMNALGKRATRGTLVAISAILAGAVSACSDSTEPLRSDARYLRKATASRPRAESPELRRQDELAAELARGIALALGDVQKRRDLILVMRASPHREHKLELRKLLIDSEGLALRGEVQRRMGQSAERFARFLDSLPPIEVYLPVREHRAKWVGSGDLLVAAALHEGEDPVGFALDGSRVQLSEAAPPSQPVLVLTSKETDFDNLPDTRTWRNADDSNGEAVGTLVSPMPDVIEPPCDTCEPRRRLHRL